MLISHDLSSEPTRLRLRPQDPTRHKRLLPAARAEAVLVEECGSEADGARRARCLAGSPALATTPLAFRAVSSLAVAAWERARRPNEIAIGIAALEMDRFTDRLAPGVLDAEL